MTTKERASVGKNQCVHFLQLNYILCVKHRKKVHEGQLVDFVASTSPSSSSVVVNLGKTMLHFIAHDFWASGCLWYFDMTILSPPPPVVNNDASQRVFFVITPQAVQTLLQCMPQEKQRCLRKKLEKFLNYSHWLINHNYYF